LCLEELGQADDLRAAAGGIGHAVQSLGQVLLGFGAARHLHQPHTILFHGGDSSAFNIAKREEASGVAALEAML
jgi:hypothetical protein